jgi:CubicO group peptidase (beta-lactamase class C family)
VSAPLRFVFVASIIAALAAPAARVAGQGSGPTYWPTDGWRTEAPEEHGIDPAALAAVDARVPSETPDLSALLVVRDGVLVFEEYYNGQEPEEPINVRSVTKSVTGALVGIALAEGYLEGLDQTVGELIPERIPDGADPRVADITIERLLTMTSGLDGRPPANGLA